MSRLHYAFQDPGAFEPELRKPRASLRTRIGNRRFLQSAVETAGLFAFGFGSTSLVLNLAAGLFLFSV